MSRVQSVELVLRLFDRFTKMPLSTSGGRFTYNGISLQPTKVLPPYVVFTDLLGNPRYAALSRSKVPGLLQYEHPHYAPFQVGAEGFGRVEGVPIWLSPRPGYPVPPGTTGLIGKASGAVRIAVVHRHSREQFLLKEDWAPGAPLAIARSDEASLEGKKFLMGEGGNGVEMVLEKRDEAYYARQEPEQSFPKGTPLYEIIEADVVDGDRFLLLFPSFYDKQQEVPIDMDMVLADGSTKKARVSIKKETLVEVSL